jgi:hypothetical protein
LHDGAPASPPCMRAWQGVEDPGCRGKPPLPQQVLERASTGCTSPTSPSAAASTAPHPPHPILGPSSTPLLPTLILLRRYEDGKGTARRLQPLYAVSSRQLARVTSARRPQIVLLPKSMVCKYGLPLVFLSLLYSCWVGARDPRLFCTENSSWCRVDPQL